MSSKKNFFTQLGYENFYGTGSCLTVSSYASVVSRDDGNVWVNDLNTMLSIKKPVGKTESGMNLYRATDPQNGRVIDDKKMIKLSDFEVEKIKSIVNFINQAYLEGSDFTTLIQKLDQTPGVNDFKVVQTKDGQVSKINYSFFRNTGKDNTKVKPTHMFNLSILPPMITQDGRTLPGFGVSFAFVNASTQKPEYSFTVRDLSVVNSIVNTLDMFNKYQKEFNCGISQLRTHINEQAKKKFQVKNVNKEVVIDPTEQEEKMVDVIQDDSVIEVETPQRNVFDSVTEDSSELIETTSKPMFNKQQQLSQQKQQYNKTGGYSKPSPGKNWSK